MGVTGARRRVTGWVPAAVLVPLVALSGCILPSGAPTLSTSAVFSDVGDLAGGAPVELADLPVGHVTTLTLDGLQARVGMSLSVSADVPADVTAELRRTTILGEQYIDLVAPSSPPGGRGPLLSNGSVVTHAEVVPGIEQLVSSGSAVFGAINTTDLAQLVATGAQALGGEGQNLRQLLDELGTVVHGYAGRTATIEQLVGDAQQLTSSLGPDAQADAQALSTIADTTAVLAQQSGRLESLLQSLDDLSVQGRSLLESYIPQIDDQLHGLAVTAQTLQSSEADIGGLIDALPGHNASTRDATVDDELQVLDDLIVCGIPGGGADASQPSLTCDGSS